MKFTAQQIAGMIQGVVEGDAETAVHGIAKIEEGKPGDLCFLANSKYEEYLYTTEASVVLVQQDLKLRQPVTPALIRVKDAYAAFAQLLHAYQEMKKGHVKTGIEKECIISGSAQIGTDVYIGGGTYVSDEVQVGKNSSIHPLCFLGSRVTIGEGSVLYAGVKVYDDCVIGDHVIIHSGTVIGSDGFGFAFENGRFNKIPQLGNVIVEDHVEIGANCTIDRATMGSTRIRKGAKLDNLIQVAHNVEIGENTVIAAQAGISGSTKVGNYVMVGGQAGIVGHIKIADGTRINAQSGVSKEVKEKNAALTGSPAYDYRSSLKSQAVYRQLPELQKRVAQLEHQLRQLLDK